jgi:hypothetical protein
MRYRDSYAFGTYDEVHHETHVDPHFGDDGECLCFCKQCSGPCAGTLAEDCICPDCPCPVSKGRLS